LVGSDCLESRRATQWAANSRVVSRRRDEPVRKAGDEAGRGKVRHVGRSDRFASLSCRYLLL
jgi:hypothetical protein